MKRFCFTVLTVREGRISFFNNKNENALIKDTICSFHIYVYNFVLLFPYKFKYCFIFQSQKRAGTVNPTTFSEMYTKIPEVLAEKEKKELSCSLAFVALLHLCNEQNLALKQLPGYTDFEIRGPN